MPDNVITYINQCAIHDNRFDQDLPIDIEDVPTDDGLLHGTQYTDRVPAATGPTVVEPLPAGEVGDGENLPISIRSPARASPRAMAAAGASGSPRETPTKTTGRPFDWSATPAPCSSTHTLGSPATTGLGDNTPRQLAVDDFEIGDV